MAIKKVNPTTPARRGMTVLDTSDLSKAKPLKSLRFKLKSNAGRNAYGRLTVRHKGAGAKRLYRIIDFSQKKLDIPGKITSVQYDPYRSSRIGLVTYIDGEKSYIILPVGAKVGDSVICSKKGEAKPGNRFLLKNIPQGTFVYGIELYPGKGAQLARSAGTLAQITGQEGKYVLVKLPSGEVRKILAECFASIGQVSNPEASLVKIGKAGRKRHMGIRPTVRGKAMAPVAHPHGGGEGQNDIGMPYQKTPWGAHALGKKTRRRKLTDKYIVTSRKKKR